MAAHSTPIDGATTASYRRTDADIGKTMGLDVYGEASGHHDAGATGASYKVTTTDLTARSLSVKVYAVKAGWTTGTALSAPVGRIGPSR